MTPFMAADLAGVFAYDFPCVCVVNGVEFTVLTDDNNLEEADAYGGPIPINPQEIHFQTKDLSEIENGILVTLYQTKQGVRGKGVSLITISSVTSADGNELIVKARAQ